jgi:hypothetical protein
MAERRWHMEKNAKCNCNCNIGKASKDGIYMFLLLDNDQKGGDPANAFLVQYVRVCRLDASNRST